MTTYPPNALPWVVGGPHQIWLSTTTKICLAYARVVVKADADWSIGPSPMLFGGPAGVQQPPQDITVANTGGTQAIVITALRFGKPDASGWSFTNPPPLPLTIPVGQTAKISLTCTPGEGAAPQWVEFDLAQVEVSNTLVLARCVLVGPRVLGSNCTSAAECPSGFCVSGVCCDSACTDQCATCVGATSRGHCAPAYGSPDFDKAPCSGHNLCAFRSREYSCTGPMPRQKIE